MSITIENWSNGDVLYHSLVIIKGIIRGVLGKQVTVSVNARKELSWPIIEGRFNVLVQLKLGLNSIDVNCGLLREEFKLIYRFKNAKPFVRLVYIVCSDSNGCFQGPGEEDCSVISAKSRLSFGARLLQSVTAKTIHDHGLSPRTFSLEEDSNGDVVCHVFYSKLTTAETHEKNQQALWDHFAVELMASPLANQNCRFLAFLSSTCYVGSKSDESVPKGYTQVLSQTRGHVALGGGGLALLGTGCLYTWATDLLDFRTRIEDCRLVDGTRFMDNSCNRGTLWACYISGLGAALHELAHVFNVGHSAKGIMGLGFHQIQNELKVSLKKTCCVCSRKAHFNEKLFVKNQTGPIHEVIEGKVSVKKAKLERWLYPCQFCPDGAFWNYSSALILHNHRFFLEDITSNMTIKFESTRTGWLLTSSCGIMVAELRDSSGMVLAYWCSKTGVQAPLVVHLAKERTFLKSLSLVIEDIQGNVLVHEF